jgi:transposase-like protein
MANPHRRTAKHRQWREHLAAWRRSGQSAREYCRRHALCESLFYYWRRTLEKPQASTPSNSATGAASPSNAPFVPVRLIGPPSTQAVLELVLRGGRIVRVPNGFAPDALRQLITLAEQLPC